MSWDDVRNNPLKSAHDVTRVCRVDQIMLNACAERDRLKTEVDGLDIEMDALRAHLWRARAFNALALLVGGGGLFVACHPWP